MDSDGSVHGSSYWSWWQRGTLALQDRSHAWHAGSRRAALRCPQKQVLHAVECFLPPVRMVGACGRSHPPHGLTEAEIAGGERTGDQVQLSKARSHYFHSWTSVHFVKFLLPPKIAPPAGDEEWHMSLWGTFYNCTWAEAPERTTRRLNYLWIMA